MRTLLGKKKKALSYFEKELCQNSVVLLTHMFGVCKQKPDFSSSDGLLGLFS